VVAVEALPDELRRRLPLDLVLDRPNPDVLYTHRQLEGRHLYLIINNAPVGATITPALRQPGPYTLYRPLTGAIDRAGDRLQMDLEPYEGLFVVCG
jgi:hypothetical protein